MWNKASARLATPPAGPTQAGGPLTSPAGPVAAGATTQRVTVTDLAAGQIRIPIAYKAVFPTERQQITIVLRDETVTCGWNPQLGPDKQRSGLLRPSSVVLRRLVTPEERLTITVEDGQVVLR